MSRARKLLGLGVLGGRGGAGPTDWWLAGGINPANVVAAYQSIGAESYEASLVNLANPGTNDLTANTAPPAWDAETGWTFSGAQSFNTGIVPSMSRTQTVLVRIANATASLASIPFGARRVSRFFYVRPNGGTNMSYNYGLSGSLASDPGCPNGTLGWAGTTAYRGGLTQGTISGDDVTDLPLPSIYLGANNYSTPDYFTGDILAFVMIDGIATPAQMIALTMAMDALGRAFSPAVYVTFDDGGSGVYTNAYPYMAARGIPGTVYMTTDWIGTTGYSEYMTSAQLQALDAAGWDIGNHTKSHPIAPNQLETLSLAEQTAELDDARTALDALGLTRASSHVAYPQGSYNADTLSAMASLSMVTGRTILPGGMPRPPAAPYELPAYSYKTGVPLRTFHGNVYKALGAGQDAIIYMHDVVEEGPNEWDLLYSEFTPVIDWLVAHKIPCKKITELALT